MAELGEQIVYDQLDGDDNAVWSLLLAAGYLKILSPYEGEKTLEDTLANAHAQIDEK